MLTYTYVMAPDREHFNFWIDSELRQGLRDIKERDGIPEAEQVRRAIRQWLNERQPDAYLRVPETPRKAKRR